MHIKIFKFWFFLCETNKFKVAGHDRLSISGIIITNRLVAIYPLFTMFGLITCYRSRSRHINSGCEIGRDSILWSVRCENRCRMWCSFSDCNSVYVYLVSMSLLFVSCTALRSKFIFVVNTLETILNVNLFLFHLFFDRPILQVNTLWKPSMDGISILFIFTKKMSVSLEMTTVLSFLNDSICTVLMLLPNQVQKIDTKCEMEF